MEAAEPVEIFQHSIQKHKLAYSQYLGDSDISLFKEVVESEPYSEFDIVPEKVECVGHAQKRLGTYLKNMVKGYNGTATPQSGKGKFTEKVINSLQNFYGIAIRQNSGDLYEMIKAVGAILWHCTNMKDIEVRHQFCQKKNPVGVNIKEIKSLEIKHTKPISVFQSGSMISSNQFLLS